MDPTQVDPATTPAAPSWGSASSAPWNPPADPEAPAWQPPDPAAAPTAFTAPVAPPPAAPNLPPGFVAPGTYTAPPTYGQPSSWTEPPSAGPPTAWAPAAAPAATARTGSPIGAIAALAGGALTLLGVFSGWVTLKVAGTSETVTAWSLTTGDGLLTSSDPYLLAGLAVVSIVIGVLLFTGIARPIARIAAIIVGVAILAVAALNWTSVASFVSDNFASSDTAKTAIGFYFALAGGLLAAVAGVLPSKK